MQRALYCRKPPWKTEISGSMLGPGNRQKERMGDELAKVLRSTVRRPTCNWRRVLSCVSSHVGYLVELNNHPQIPDMRFTIISSANTEAIIDAQRMIPLYRGKMPGSPVLMSLAKWGWIRERYGNLPQTLLVADYPTRAMRLSLGHVKSKKGR